MADDSFSDFRHQREQRDRSLVIEQSANWLDDFHALCFAERALMDADDGGAVCICSGPDLHHHLDLTMLADVAARPC